MTMAFVRLVIFDSMSLRSGFHVTWLRLPDITEKMIADGNEIVGSTPEELAALLRVETVKWAKVAKAAGIQPE